MATAPSVSGCNSTRDHNGYRSTISKPALKTNLLLDAAGAPNIGLEIPAGKNFSVTLSGMYARCRFENAYSLQTVQGGLDVKYWFDSQKKPLTGWNAGIYGVYGGPWDIQRKQGWQGDRFFSTGMVAGYSMPLDKNLNLEFSLGAGWFYTPEARHYHYLDREHLMWQQTRRNVGRFSITKLQLNLVWLITGKKR